MVVFSNQRGIKLTFALGAVAAFACSNGLPDEKAQGQAGAGGAIDQAGSGATHPGDTHAGNGGTGDGGTDSNEAGADSGASAGDGGSDSNDPGGSDGGKPSSNGGKGGSSGGAQNTGGVAGNVQAGSGNAKGGAGFGGGSGGGLFTITPPTADCEAAPPANVGPTTPAPGLGQPPTTGHACDAPYEPNDSDGQACQLALGAEVQTQLTGTDDKIDNFVFHAEAGVRYTLIVSTLDCVGGNNAIQVSAKSLASTDPTVQLEQNAYFGTKNSYEIKSNTTANELVTFKTGVSCQYDFKIVQSTAQGLEHGTDYEPNGTPSTAPVLELNQLVSSRLAGKADQVDYFTVPVQANLTYTLHVSTEHCSGSNSSIYLNGSSLGSGVEVANLAGQRLYFGGIYDLEFTTSTSGPELLRFETGDSCEYKLYVIPSSICGLGHDAYYEPNNTPSTAAPITLDQTVSAEVQPLDTIDYYSFAVEPKTKYTLSLSPTNCPGNNNSLWAQVWSGRTAQLDNGSARFYYTPDKKTLTFTTGSATQELLKIESSSSCGYDFIVSKG